MSKMRERIMGAAIFSPGVVVSSIPAAASGAISGTVSNPGGSVAGLTVTIKKNGSTIGTATTDGSGAWSYSASGLANGDVITASASVTVSSGGTVARAAAAVWLLAGGVWNDAGVWSDSSNWIG